MSKITREGQENPKPRKLRRAEKRRTSFLPKKGAIKSGEREKKDVHWVLISPNSGSSRASASRDSPQVEPRSRCVPTEASAELGPTLSVAEYLLFLVHGAGIHFGAHEVGQRRPLDRRGKASP